MSVLGAGETFQLQEASRPRDLPAPFDLARTVAPVSWAAGRWPSVDWRGQTLWWVGWEGNHVVWRSVCQRGAVRVAVTGSAAPGRDRRWAARVLGAWSELPEFDDPVLQRLARKHCGLRPWAAGSLFEGAVSSIAGQSISVAAAAVTERRLAELFNDAIELGGRRFWPPVRCEQLADASPELVRCCGVTMARAHALVAVGVAFASGAIVDVTAPGYGATVEAEKLREIAGVGPWTVQSALLWGVGQPDAHPSGDVALLRAARQHYDLRRLRDVDQLAARWAPFRGWAARLLWVDLLGFAGPPTGTT